mmetsp:Transcript_2772/g.6034  ORF Transcript_2772/g.6034 Transcript_2772/m.6034 type:complete len:98 (+) Transcript_2772:1268-1561(+)
MKQQDMNLLVLLELMREFFKGRKVPSTTIGLISVGTWNMADRAPRGSKKQTMMFVVFVCLLCLGSIHTDLWTFIRQEILHSTRRTPIFDSSNIEATF